MVKIVNNEAPEETKGPKAYNEPKNKTKRRATKIKMKERS